MSERELCLALEAAAQTKGISIAVIVGTLSHARSIQRHIGCTDGFGTVKTLRHHEVSLDNGTVISFYYDDVALRGLRPDRVFIHEYAYAYAAFAAAMLPPREDA